MTGADTRPRMRLLAFKPLRKGSLIGFAEVTLPNGLTISDIPVCTSHGKVWASLPSKAILDRDGRHVEQDGKRKYVPILQWADRSTNDRWSDAVIALVRERHPDALDDGGPA
jgi:DNA-binding cell septation regulator SpoVG